MHQDDIPSSVKGIGEKTAIKLLTQYGSLDGRYENIDNIKGSTHEKLVTGNEDAYYSKELVTIYREVPLNITWDDLLYGNENTNELIQIIIMNLIFILYLKRLVVIRKM